MKKTLFMAIAVIAGFGGAQATVLTCDVSATIKKAIVISQTTPMAFGTITPLPAAGVVVLSSAGARTTPTLAVYGTSNAGAISITAEPSTLLNIAFAGGTVTSGANTMTVSSFNSTSVPASNTTSAAGALTLNVGSTLNVGANQASGLYAGTYTLTVNY